MFFSPSVPCRLGSFTRITISQEPTWTLVATNLGHEICFVSCFPTIYIYIHVMYTYMLCIYIYIQLYITVYIYILNIKYYILYIIYYILYTVYYILYIVYYILYIIFYRSPQAWWGSATGYWASNQRSNNGRKFAMIYQLKWTFTKNLGLIRFYHSKIVFFPPNQFQTITLSRRSVSTGRWPDGIRRKDLCAKRTCEVGSGLLDSCKVLCCCWFLHNSSN